MSALSAEQVKAAQQLRDERPPVIPGTNVIPNEAARIVWFNKVLDVMRTSKLVGNSQINEFCNIAGVPD